MQRGHPGDLQSVLTTVASLTSAQHALLSQISRHSSPVTVTELAEENGHHVSSVRETLEALYALGLVTREQMPISGRGRPAHGYITYTPTDPAFPARMLEQATQAVFSWLREAPEIDDLSWWSYADLLDDIGLEDEVRRIADLALTHEDRLVRAMGKEIVEDLLQD